MNSPLLFFAPGWMVFELAQLVVGERYLGMKQNWGETDPRERGPGEWVAFFWSAGILLYWVWMVLMLYQTVGTAQVFTMVAVSTIGVLVRRGCGVKRVLVVLTFEGALRIGMLMSLCAIAWKAL